MVSASGTIQWPQKFAPERAPIHVTNRLEINAGAEAVWAWLIRASEWPSWYANSSNVVLADGSRDLGPTVAFRWRTFGVDLVSEVQEFVPYERIAWDAKGTGVLAYHAWLISPRAQGCSVLTEETQSGLLARLGNLFMPGRMHRQHQNWLEGLRTKAESGLPR